MFAEPLLAHFFDPFSASAFGGTYHLLSFGWRVPYWDFAFGIAWTDLAPRIQEQSTTFNFVVETGLGLVSSHTAMSLAARFHHFSNAGLGERNAGLFLVGVAYYFPR